MQSFNALKTAYELNPAALQAKVVKWLAVFGVIVGLMIGSYFYGTRTANQSWETKTATLRAQVAQLRADNAIDAGKRLGHYTKTDAQLEHAVAQAKQMVHDYYAKHPNERVVEKTKLVPVPGKEEYVYVPVGTCPNDFLNADELQLWNLGAAGYNPDADNPK